MTTNYECYFGTPSKASYSINAFASKYPNVHDPSFWSWSLFLSKKGFQKVSRDQKRRLYLEWLQEEAADE